MSRWTNILLLAGAEGFDDPVDGLKSIYPAISFVNDHLGQRHPVKLFMIRDELSGYGLDCCFAGSLNHLDLEALVAVIKTAPWEQPESVQLLVKIEDEARFREIDLEWSARI